MLIDLHRALRRWVSRPAFAAAAVLTLALGIGATTAVFSVVDAVLLKPLPWRDPDQLVTVWVTRPHWRDNPVLAASWDRGNLSWPIFEDLQTKSRVFSEVGTWSMIRPTLNGERNELVYGMQISASFLPLLGVSPHLGRFFTPEEDDVVTEAVLVSYESWQRRFGGTPDVLGRRVSLDEKTYSIAGVLPPGFNFDGRDAREFFLAWGNLPAAGNKHAGNHFMYGVARVKPGIPPADVLRDTEPHVRGAEKPEEKQARVTPLADEQFGTTRRPLWILLGASALLLLIACANVAGLLLGDAGSRRYEIALRTALGGSRRQVVRQLLVESLVLAWAAVVAGVLVALVLTPLLVSLAPVQLPRIGTVGIDARVLAFALAVGALTAVCFGMAPAISLSSVDPMHALRDGSRSGTARRFRGSRIIVAGEVALAVVLLAGASLLAETLLRLTAQPVGFDPGNLLVTSLRVPRDPASTPQSRTARTDQLVARLASLPGVVDATVTSTAPFSGSYGSNSIQIEGKTFDRDPPAARHIVSDRYLQTLRIPIVKGRGFEPSDAPGDHVAVVTQEFERRYFDGEAIGKRFTLNGDVHRVVGVVPATKHREYNDDESPAFYALNRQLPTWATPTYILRTANAPEPLFAAVRKTIESAEPLSSIVTIETMTMMMRRSVAEERYRALLSSLFAGTALLLSAVGLYGLMMRSVSDRQREIGLRMAVGAEPRAVLGLVMREGILLVAVGLGAGVLASMAVSQVIGSLLYGVTTTAPHTFALVSTVLGATALVAMLVPATRAAHVDPLVALRDQ